MLKVVQLQKIMEVNLVRDNKLGTCVIYFKLRALYVSHFIVVTSIQWNKVALKLNEK